MRLLRQIFKNSSMFGFDSFEGLPKAVLWEGAMEARDVPVGPSRFFVA